MLVAVTQSSSNDNAIRYVLPVLHIYNGQAQVTTMWTYAQGNSPRGGAKCDVYDCLVVDRMTRSTRRNVQCYSARDLSPIIIHQTSYRPLSGESSNFLNFNTY